MACPDCASTATTRRKGRTALGYRRFRCQACRRRFNERTGTPFNDQRDAGNACERRESRHSSDAIPDEHVWIPPPASLRWPLGSRRPPSTIESYSSVSIRSRRSWSDSSWKYQ